METKDVNKLNIKVLAKLGVDSKDIAKIYLEITEKGKDISKDTYINNLTEMLKFFQTRNNNINNSNDEAIYKDDALKMIKANKKLVGLDIDKKIKPICQKIDSYYFMNPGYTNKLIKRNPKIFNINNLDLEIYSIVLSNFAIKIDGQVINLLEYIIKQKSEFLENDVQKIYGRIMYLSNNKDSKLFTKEEIDEIESKTFVKTERELREKYKLPIYNGEGIEIYSKKVLENIK